MKKKCSLYVRHLTVKVAIVLIAAAIPNSAALAVGKGDKAPAFALPSLSGKGKVSLADYRGKVVWVDFWASWCAPCLKSLPQLEEMRKELPAKDFQILAINVDQKTKKATKFLAKHPVGYPSGSDPDGRIPELYGLETMPTSYLVDRKGVVHMVHEGFRKEDMEKIKSDISRLIRKKK